ncbi:LuxR C-terminal-related transcriptional regulator [Kitasatospora sp. NPDC059408]|uniref:LuxR C-terminal-related transcriptional regulator n=1 Tax=Kitasatospora sp. NPDC059408 TaxID=3346823 RepID=UPI00368C4901
MVDVHERYLQHPVSRPERELLFTALDALREGRGGAIELIGGPGSGKSTLLGELTRRAARLGIRRLGGRSTEGDRGLPLPALERALTHVGDGLLLILDDVHWADRKTMAAIGELIHWQLDRPLLLVLAHRPGQAPPDLRGILAYGLRIGTLQRIRIGPLTLAQSAQLLGLPADHPSLPDLHREAEGNPLYLQALGAAAGTAAHADATAPVPEALADLLLGEIAGLDAEEASVLNAAAVLGGEVTVAALAEVAELSQTSACAVTARLVGRDLLRRSGPHTYRFRHPVLQRTIYQSLDACWSFGAHRRALTVLTAGGASPTERARHIEVAIASSDAKDIRTLVQAAEEHLWSEPARAGHWLSTALCRLSHSAHLVSIERLGHAGRPDGDLARARDLLGAIIRATSDTRLRALAVRLCAQAESYLGRPTEASALLSTSIAELSGPDPARADQGPAELAQLIAARAALEALEGGMPAAEEIELALRIERRHPDELLRVGLLALRGLCAALTPDGELGRAAISAGAASVDTLSDLELLSNPEYLALLGWAEILLGRFHDALRHLCRGVTVTIRSGRTRTLTPLLNALCYLGLYLGPAVEADPTAREALQLAEQLDFAEVRGMILALRSATASWGSTERNDRAVWLAEQAVVALQPGDAWAVSATLCLARAVAVNGDFQRCTLLITNLGKGPRLPALPSILRPLCYEMLTAAAVATADPAATTWAERATAAAAALPDQPMQHGYATAARAHVLAERDPAAAAELYRSAALLFGGVGMTAVQAWTLLLGSAPAAATGAHQDAAAMLVMAKDLARRCGASRVYVAAQLREQAPAPAAADADDPLTVLTGREYEVAALVGVGKKTREIARELNLSPRTVDVHLSRIFRKLAVGNRAALARLMTLAETAGRAS